MRHCRPPFIQSSDSDLLIVLEYRYYTMNGAIHIEKGIVGFAYEI